MFLPAWGGTENARRFWTIVDDQDLIGAVNRAKTVNDIDQTPLASHGFQGEMEERGKGGRSRGAARNGERGCRGESSGCGMD